MTLATRLVLLALCVTMLRIAILAITPTDLFFDEAQYWAWSQNLDWGYFSKPPLIAWVIGVTTGLGGSDAPFWVRLGAPILHGITSVLVGLFVASVERRAALWATALYLSMPILAVGSWMISTDTVMAPFLVGALWAWWHHLQSGTLKSALLAGVLVGFAVMAKYAGAYFWIMVLVAALFATLRPSPKGALIALAGFLVVLSPNVLWNLQNGFITLSHTADNASWSSNVGLKWDSLAEFLGWQTIVIGPLFFVIWIAALRGTRDRFERFLLCASLPVLLLVCGQALASRAFANWAFAAYPAAAALVALVLVRAERWTWLRAGFGLNVALIAVITAVIVWPPLLPLATDRYIGREALTQDILAVADGRALAATERDLLADLTYAATRNGGTGQVFAMERQNPAGNWYEMVSLRPDNTAVLLVTSGAAPLCDGQALSPERVFEPSGGAYSEDHIKLFQVPAGCN